MSWVRNTYFYKTKTKNTENNSVADPGCLSRIQLLSISDHGSGLSTSLIPDPHWKIMAPSVADPDHYKSAVLWKTRKGTVGTVTFCCVEPEHSQQISWKFFLEKQCSGTETIFYGSSSDVWKVTVPVPTFDTAKHSYLHNWEMTTRTGWWWMCARKREPRRILACKLCTGHPEHSKIR